MSRIEVVFLASAVFFVGLVAGGNDDYAEAQRQQEIYCDMTAAGHWPAYSDGIKCEQNNAGR